MACDARQVLLAGTQFRGLSVPQFKAVQLQLAADSLLAYTPDADVSIAAVLERAKANGFCCLTRLQLRSTTLQLLCTIKEGL